MPGTRTKEDLLADLDATAEEYFDGGRNCNILDMALTISVIVTSLIAAALAATDISRWIRVGVATIPAAFTSIQKIIDVKARSNWYFSYAARLRALATTSEFSVDTSLEEIARERAGIDLDMEKAWGDIGRRNSQSRAPSSRR